MDGELRDALFVKVKHFFLRFGRENFLGFGSDFFLYLGRKNFLRVGREFFPKGVRLCAQ